MPERPPATASRAPARVTAPRVWSVRIFTSGGFSGSGRGSVAIRSDCKLPEATRLSIETAVAGAHPELWLERYELATPRMTDQFYYRLTLQIGDTVHSTGWQSDSAGELPADLHLLYEMVWAARADASNCR